MRKAIFIFLLLFICRPPTIFSQCLTAPPPPDCYGTELLVVDNEILNEGTTKWYYGSTVILNSLTLNGGTLVISGNLTVDKFYMDSGAIYVRPGARFVIGGGIGAGLVLKGNSSIYNYGTFEIQRNLSLENGYATAGKPNRVINATASSIFRMPNQYFVINNIYSWFVNNGVAEFWGIITDQQALPASVCLGKESNTHMAVLINKIAATYRVPDGTACVSVSQLSQFNNKLTNDQGLFACLGSSHNSYSGCGGCPANNWGAAQVFTSCAGCSALTVLSTQFSSFTVVQSGNGENKLSWQTSPVESNGLFKIERSGNGKNYQALDSFIVKETGASLFNSVDKNPMGENNYYMIKYINPATGVTINSKPVKVFSENINGFTVYPVPFDNKFFIGYVADIEKIILTDMAGRNIAIRHSTRRDTQLIEVEVLEKIESGIYIIHIRTGKNSMAKTIFKK